MVFGLRKCVHDTQLGESSKIGERVYLITVATRQKRKSRDEIVRLTEESFRKGGIETQCGLSYEEYVDRLVEIENVTFCGQDSAFIPSSSCEIAVLEKDLDKARRDLEDYVRKGRGKIFWLRQLLTFSCLLRPIEVVERHQIAKSALDGWKIVSTEINGSTTDAARELYRKCGVKLAGFAGLPREELTEKVNRFVESAQRHPFVSGLYLIGSLARGDSSCVDADVIMVRRYCPGIWCDVSKSLNLYNVFAKDAMGIGWHCNYGVDLVCCDEKRFKFFTEGRYSIVQDRQLLYQR